MNRTAMKDFFTFSTVKKQTSNINGKGITNNVQARRKRDNKTTRTPLN